MLTNPSLRMPAALVAALVTGLALALGAGGPAAAQPAPEPLEPGANAPAATVYCNSRALFSLSGQTFYLPVGPGNNQDCIMNQGAYSSGVLTLQRTLVSCYGQNTGGLDSDYGPLTRQAVENVQGSLLITVDGVYGPQTGSNMLFSPLGNGWLRTTGSCTTV